MDFKYSQHIQGVLNYSKEEALRLGTPVIGLEHLLLGILRDGEGEAVAILQRLGADLNAIRQTVENHIRPNKFRAIPETADIPLTKATERVLKLVYLEAKSFKSPEIKTEHLLLAILREENAFVTQMLHDMSIDYLAVREKLENITGIEFQPGFTGRAEDEYVPAGGGPPEREPAGKSQQSAKTNSETPVIDNFGTDLTKAAEENRLDPIVGREKEIERLVQILSRRKKNNPILIGEPGVGKSAIVEGLALRITQRNVNATCRGYFSGNGC